MLWPRFQTQSDGGLMVYIPQVSKKHLVKSSIRRGYKRFISQASSPILSLSIKVHVGVDTLLLAEYLDVIFEIIRQFQTFRLNELILLSFPIALETARFLVDQLIVPSGGTLRNLSILEHSESNWDGLDCLADGLLAHGIKLECFSVICSLDAPIHRFMVKVGNIKHLSLLNGELTDQSLASLCEWMKQFGESLEHLDVQHCEIKISLYNILCQSLANLTKQGRLNLKSLGIKCADYYDLACLVSVLSLPSFRVQELAITREDEFLAEDELVNLIDDRNIHVLELKTDGDRGLVFWRNICLLNFMQWEAVRVFHVAKAWLTLRNYKSDISVISRRLPLEVIERILFLVPEMPILTMGQIRKINSFAMNGGSIHGNGSRADETEGRPSLQHFDESYSEKPWMFGTDRLLKKDQVSNIFVQAVDCERIAPFPFSGTLKEWVTYRIYQDMEQVDYFARDSLEPPSDSGDDSGGSN